MTACAHCGATDTQLIEVTRTRSVCRDGPACTDRRDTPDVPFPVSGRPEPRPAGLVVHDVRFLGGASFGSGVIAWCEPCQWSTHLEDGHTAADLTRLTVMHCGGESS